MSASLSPSPRLRFFGNDGAPLAGGSLITYDNETSLPVATYNDAGMAAENPEQLPLDANGEPSYEGSPRNVFLKNGKFYKFKWFDKDGNLVGGCDNIGASGSGGGSGNAIVRGAENEGIKVSSMIDSSGNTVYIVALTEDVLTVLATAYIVPNGGIPKTDLAQGVQDSLELADTAVQPDSLVKRVRVDAEQTFNDTEKVQGRSNINAQKDIGGPGAFIDTGSVDSSNVWAQIGELDLNSLGIATGKSLASCYSNISLSLEFTVYNTGNTDGAIVERGRFDINVHADPSNGKWNYDAQWTSYDSRVAGTHIIDSMRVSKKMNVSEIKTLTLHAKVPAPSTFKDNALNVSVLKNYGTTHRTDNMNTVKSFVKPWTLWICTVWHTFTLGTNESPAPIGRYLSGNYDSYVDFPTVHAPQLSVLDTPYYTQTDGNNAVKRGDLPVIVDQRFGEGATAFPIEITDSAQKFASINAVRRMSVFNGGPSGNILYLARLSSTGFMTPTIDTTSAGLYLVGEDFLFPMAGQTRSISVYFEVVDPGSSVYNVMATWRRYGTDDPKEFNISVTYFGNTVGCWHGTKTLSTTETALVVTDFENMVKLEIDFISTDGERWYHFEYIKEANRSRMVEY